MSKFVKVDKWLEQILVDPLDKGPLENRTTCLTASYGRHYPIVEGIYDLRLLTQHVDVVGELWKEGQKGYERWSGDLAKGDGNQDYVAERESVRDVYEAIPIVGRCLDIGGH